MARLLMIYKNHIKKVRLSNQISQIRLAAETGVYFSTLSRLEHGWLKPTDTQKKKLARALKVSIEELFPIVPKSQEAQNSNEKRKIESRQ
jgi:transcriptional regulator with XRE-family HTH domain